MNIPFRPMAASDHFLRMVKEMNEWKVDCTGDDDCIICREFARLVDVWLKEVNRADGD